MNKIFNVRQTTRLDQRTYEVVAGSEGEPGVVIAAHRLPCAADDLALLLNRITALYQADCSNRTSKELTWDLLCRIDSLAPFL